MIQMLRWTKPSSVGNVLEVSAPVLGGRVYRNGGRWLPPKFVGKADLGGRLALLARRALLPDKEGTGNGAGRRDLQSLLQC